MPIAIRRQRSESQDQEAVATIEICQVPSSPNCILRLVEAQIHTAETAFYIVDLGNVVQQMDRWRALLPRVRPFYAVKCQPDPQIVKLLASMGAGFDCASRAEIALAIDHLPGVTGQQPLADQALIGHSVIYANPFKFKKDIAFAARRGVRWTTFDCESELIKLSKEWPTAELVLRILPQRNYKATVAFAEKFGASPKEVPVLLSKAKALGMQVAGLSFHVGSGCKEGRAWAETVEYCRSIFDLANEIGFSPYLLDIGGGFPGLSSTQSVEDREIQAGFEIICAGLNQALDTHFPPNSGYTIIAEPGRYFVSGAYTLATQVIGKRDLDLSTVSDQSNGAGACASGDASNNCADDSDKEEVPCDDMHSLDNGCGLEELAAGVSRLSVSGGGACCLTDTEDDGASSSLCFPDSDLDDFDQMVAGVGEEGAAACGIEADLVSEDGPHGCLMDYPELDPAEPDSTKADDDSGHVTDSADHDPVGTDDAAQSPHGFRYVINDGVYGSFNCIIFDHAQPKPACIFSSGAENICDIYAGTRRYPSKMFGPTCDSFDCVLHLTDLPELQVGDWLVWPDMGAYTLAAGTEFNGIRIPTVSYHLCLDTAEQLCRLRSAARSEAAAAVVEEEEEIHHRHRLQSEGCCEQASLGSVVDVENEYGVIMA